MSEWFVALSVRFAEIVSGVKVLCFATLEGVEVAKFDQLFVFDIL